MNKLVSKPHFFFFVLTIVFTILGFINRNQNIEFHFGEEFFVLPLDFWYWLSSVFFILIGFNYAILIWADKAPKKWLTILHISLQIISLLLLATKNQWNWIGNQNPEELNSMTNNYQMVFTISIILFISSIFFHLINFFVTLFLKKN